MNTSDHYAKAQELADLLYQEGLSDYADLLINSMQEGATGTEIFMALRWNVKKIIDAKKCSDVTEAKARRLYWELDNALR